MMRLSGGAASRPFSRTTRLELQSGEVPPVERSVRAERSGAAVLGTSAIALTLAAVLYNTLLAFLNARGLDVGRGLVIVTEIAVLCLTAVVLLRSELRQSDTPLIALATFFVVNALLVSLASESLFIDMARNVAIIALFAMLGARIDERTLKRTFAIIAGLVLAILVLEGVSVNSYAWLLEPGRYFEQTRGISRFELDEIGLFANALGFDDRFSILNIVGHRTSSVFLEQVSLANFAAVLTTFVVAFWPRLSWRLRLAFPLLVALILVTNNSRTALAIALAAPAVYWIAPTLPRLVALALLPVILLASTAVAWASASTKEDNLVGRLQLTVRTLGDMDVAALFGARAQQALEFADSGYTFVIYGASIFGLVTLWLFFSLFLAAPGAAQKRANLMMGVYLFLNLTVSGTSVFSIKTAALLWLLAGFLRRETDGANAPSTMPKPVGG